MEASSKYCSLNIRVFALLLVVRGPFSSSYSFSCTMSGKGSAFGRRW